MADGFISRALSWFRRGASAPWVTFGPSYKSDLQWFQKALDLGHHDTRPSTAAYSCVNIISQEIASLAVNHWREDRKGERERVTSSAAARVLANPNEYQTRVDFLLFVLRALLFRGAGYAWAQRNARNEVDELHALAPGSCFPAVDPVSGALFYSGGDYDDGLFKFPARAPARDVLALRINCSRHPLIGETPIQAYALSASSGTAIQAHTAAFFHNMSRPSGLLTTPQTITKDQREQMRSDWERVSSGSETGKTPVLSHDVKWQLMTMSAVDSEIIDSYKMTVRDVAMAYRVPLYMLGDMEKATFRNTEQMFRTFYQSSLRFYLEHTEAALNRLFGFDGVTEYVEFDIESGLMRSELDTRMTAYARGVQGGILAPNEVRARESLGPVEGGDQVFLQQQMIPVSIAAKGPPEPAPAPAPATPEPAPSDEDEAAAADEAEKAILAAMQP
jgi:HK97 family phage portal protein